MTHSHLKGGNITDISHEEGLKLIIKYWSTLHPPLLEGVHTCFVGDVHGDLHQFLAPLIMNGIITLNTTIHEEKHKYQESSLFLPTYTINTSDNRIIYLGDMIDEWIFSRQVVHILRDLLTNTKNIVYIYGNHDLALIGRYFLFKENKISIPYDLPPLWETLKNELNYHKNIKIYGDKIEYAGDMDKGLDFLNDYLSSLFEDMYYIFSNSLGQLSKVCIINNIPFIISHSTWTVNSLKQLLYDKVTPSDRPGDNDASQTNKMTNSMSTQHEQSNKIISNVINSSRTKTYPESKEEYEQLSLACNDLFNSQSRLFITKNGITYTRNKESIFLNQITGHTSGSEWRDIDVNPGLSKFYTERVSKLTPEIINNRKIYYFDFDCSAGYDHDEISRPDYVYTTNEGLNVTNLPSFNYVMSNKSQAMIISSDKTPHTRNKSMIKD